MLRNTLLALSLIIAFMHVSPAAAKDFDTSSFAQIPVLHEGRIKPIQSFARAISKQLSGHDKNAMMWLVETIFNPALAEDTPILKIRNPDVVNLLQINRRADGLYSYKTIKGAIADQQPTIISILKTPEEDWTAAQSDLIMLQFNAVLLGDLLSSLTLFLPLSVTLPDNVPEALKPYAGRTLTHMDTLKFRETLQDQVKQIVKRKGEDFSRYNEAEAAITYLGYAVANVESASARSRALRVIPATSPDEPWLSPWETINSGAGRPETAALFEQWQNMALSYHDGNAAAWYDAAKEIRKSTIDLAAPSIRPAALKAEHLYNALRPFLLSSILYTACILMLTAGALWPNALYFKTAFVSLAGGAALHALGLGLRMYILQRPPVSTLYESVIFVGLIAVLYALWAYRRDQRTLWLMLGGGAGLLLHVLGFSQNQSGDSLLMLTAVLNTNFWLATHVICISAGYAFCLITSFLAHHALIKTVQEKRTTISVKLFKNIHTAALIALLFSAVGTVLGGIWADQSWGRFWGWDPKENGALLIVLWLIWLVHGRISTQMSTLLVTAGLAYLSVIVALSWFGVNLLSVGLHAYGFTDSTAWTLGLFTAAETAFVGTILWLTNRRTSHAG